MVHLRDVSPGHTHHACTVTSSAWCTWCACGCVRDRAGHGQHGPAVAGSSMATQLLQDFKLPRVSTNCDQPRDRFPVCALCAHGHAGAHWCLSQGLGLAALPHSRGSSVRCGKKTTACMAMHEVQARIRAFIHALVVKVETIRA